MIRKFPISIFIMFLLLTVGISSAQDATIITDEASGARYTVELYQTANFPVALAFAPDGRLFYTEKNTGNVRVISADGELQSEPVIHLPTDALQERGMLGIVLDPDYENNGYIWVFHTAEPTQREFSSNRVVRFHEADGVGSDPVVMFNAPITSGQLLHNGGNMAFDDTGYLYVSLGDNGDSANSQDLTVPQGKIHRFMVTDDGLIPAPDNPFEDSSIFAYGLRNPFDFAFDPVSGNLFTTENGLHCDDEINIVLRGFNYGWGADYPGCVGTDDFDVERYVPPIVSYNPTIAPTGITFYDGDAFPEWEHDLFFCSWNEGTLRRVELNTRRNQVEAEHILDLGDGSCKIDIVVGLEGGLYFTTVADGTGGIYRLLPAGD